ncbi:glycosyl transferase [Paenibacillus pectinilyticus]|uniref:Glycosyl transferase n=1 Tax=Paenibacillus pectinilyticus TaxID=512399 RepID=A0A1C0ZSK2_9BACL|nr:glycosyltransferase [Paenibacillus pectinilyticus]OCT11048.1 glycosyl transferase [Paenibacillus pectinilyticus]
MKKILLVMSSMNIGGVEKSLLSLLSIIPQESYEVTLLLLEKKGEFLAHVPDWVNVQEASWFKELQPIILQPPQKTIKSYLKNKRYSKLISFTYSYCVSKFFDLRHVYYREVFKSVPNHSNEYDVAITYQGPTDIIDYYIANKVSAAKKISWVHFDVSKFAINTKLYTKLYRKYNSIYVVSEEAQQQLLKKIPSTTGKTEVFKNVIQSNVIREMSRAPVQFDEAFNGIQIVTVGRLSKEKGQDLAIKVLARLRREGYCVRWYCIGNGVERMEYEMLIRQYGVMDDFILVGATPNPYPYIEQADIYVQPSRHEGYCLTLAEARCLCKPIVTTDFTGAHEQLVDGYNGWVVNYDENSLYDKVKYLIDHPEERDRLTNNLWKTSMDSYENAHQLFANLV